VRFPTPASDPTPPARETPRETARDSKNTPAWNPSTEPAYGREVSLPGAEKPAKTSPFANAQPPAAPAPAPARTTTREVKATTDAGGEISVPVRLGRGERLREITLRIVVEMDEAA
jgi:hypothetical protein